MGFEGYYYYCTYGYYYFSLLVLSTTFWENPLLISKSEVGGEVIPKNEGDWEGVEVYLVTISF